MADLVRNALRRKLAAAEAAGDAERVKRLRRLMPVPPVVEVAETPAQDTTVSTVTSSPVPITWWDRHEQENWTS